MVKIREKVVLQPGRNGLKCLHKMFFFMGKVVRKDSSELLWLGRTPLQTFDIHVICDMHVTCHMHVTYITLALTLT